MDKSKQSGKKLDRPAPKKKEKEKKEKEKKEKAHKKDGKIYLQVSEAKFTTTVDVTFRPLVVAEFEDQAAQSPPSRNPQKPTWTSNFLFNVTDLESSLRVKVYNNSPAKENLMANAKLSISHLGDEKQRVESFDVKGKFEGSISVIWRFESNAKPELPTYIPTEDVVGNFQFTVVSASNLKPRAGGAGRTAVAYLSYDDQKYQSTISPLTLNPTWDFTTVFRVRNFSSSLLIRLVDQDVVKRTHLGSTTITFPELIKSRGNATAIEVKKTLETELEDNPNDHAVSGEIVVRFRYKDAASVTLNANVAQKIYTELKVDESNVPPEFPPAPPAEWKTLVPQRTTDQEYKRAIRMKNLRSYWEDQLALYQRKLENNDQSGCQAVLKAIVHEMQKEENLELLEPDKRASIRLSPFGDLQFPPPPNEVPESFPGDPAEFSTEFKQWRSLRYLYDVWETNFNKFIQAREQSNREGQVKAIQAVMDAIKNSSVPPNTVINFASMGLPAPTPSRRGANYRASILPGANMAGSGGVRASPFPPGSGSSSSFPPGSGSSSSFPPGSGSSSTFPSSGSSFPSSGSSSPFPPSSGSPSPFPPTAASPSFPPTSGSSGGFERPSFPAPFPPKSPSPFPPNPSSGGDRSPGLSASTSSLEDRPRTAPPEERPRDVSRGAFPPPRSTPPPPKSPAPSLNLGAPENADLFVIIFNDQERKTILLQPIPLIEALRAPLRAKGLSLNKILPRAVDGRTIPPDVLLTQIPNACCYIESSGSKNNSEGTASGNESDGGLSSSIGEMSPRGMIPSAVAEYQPRRREPRPRSRPTENLDYSDGNSLRPPTEPPHSRPHSVDMSYSGFDNAPPRPIQPMRPPGAKPISAVEQWHLDQQALQHQHQHQQAFQHHQNDGMNDANPFLEEEQDLFAKVDQQSLAPEGAFSAFNCTGDFSLESAIPDFEGQPDMTFKSVGKTNILGRWTENKFANTSATISIEFATKSFNIGGKTVKIQLWDTAGQEKFRAISQQYYRNAHGAILVYDITNVDSFRTLETWLDPVIDMSGNENLMVMLVGNKIDLEQGRRVSTDRGLEWAEQRGLFFLETSAKDGINVHRAFQILLQEIFHRQLEAQHDEKTPTPGGPVFQIRDNSTDAPTDECPC